MTIAITGHRPHKLGNDYNLTSPLIKWVKKNIVAVLEKEKPARVISGMALGVDTLFAITASEMNIKVLAAVPCDSQDCRWPQKSRDTYNSILSNPLVETYIVCPGKYSSTCMQERNIYMVDNCDLLIAVWDGSSGGTGNCVKYAKSVDKEIVQIDPRNF